MQCAGLGTHDSHAYSSQQVSRDGACAGPLAKHAVVEVARSGRHDVWVHISAAGPAPSAPLEVLRVEVLQQQQLQPSCLCSSRHHAATGGSMAGMMAAHLK